MTVHELNKRQESAAFIWKLFLAFLRLGLTAFGGPAMVAYIRDLAVKQKGWLSDDSFKDGVALCQTIPGATAMQAAAYAGLRAGGPLGAVATYIGFGLPSFVLMVFLSALYGKAHDLPAVVSLFTGLQVIVVALVANATFNFGRRSIKKWQDVLLGLGAAGFLVVGGSPIVAIISSALLGLIFYLKLDLTKAVHTTSLQGNVWPMLRPAIVMIMLLALGLAVLFFLQRRLFDLATLMLKVDLFAFGGGYASVPLMLHEVVGVRHWMDSRVFMDGIALGQITPGPIVITATFVGYLLAGIPGAIVGTASVFTPSLIILTIVVPYFDRLQHNPFIQRGLRGALVSFVGLLLAVAIRFSVAAQWSVLSVIIAVAAFVAFRLKVDILWVVLAGAGISALVL
ncbi:MAG: chromate efflux transporter [Deltaproteobacteria bacterium]|nr:chromate efflux transporter [Deltaproteobacteria bacterium]